MKEVSCKTLDGFFRELRRRRLPAGVLAEGTPHSIEFLRDKNERIDWSTYVRILRNARAIWSLEEISELGGAGLRSPIMRAFVVVARLLFTTRELYRWTLSPTSGVGRQMWTCTHPEIVDDREATLTVTVTIEPGYEVVEEFFWFNLGGLVYLPTLLGLPRARVDMALGDSDATYVVRYRQAGGWLGWLRKLVSWPFSARAAAQELKEANETLQVRYRELEQARGVLALQATKLSTAHGIGQLIHEDLDLRRVLDAAVQALVSAAGFAAAEVTLSTELDGKPLQLRAHAGTRSNVEPLGGLVKTRGQSIGMLRAWPQPNADASERRELLDFVLPSISMALDNAITYRALADYRDNLERKVQVRTAELVSARDELADTVRSLEEAQAARERIFANINHEIRTPLTLVILSVTELKARLAPALDGRAIEELLAIETSTRKLLRLVDELLLLAAGRAGKLQLRLAACDLAQLIRLVVAAWRVSAETKSIDLAYQGPERLVREVDEEKMERVVTNLVSNATKFTPSGGSVSVELRERDGAAEILVRDTGMGIDDDLKKRLFGRFEQGRPSLHAGARGSGLGLSLVKDLVEAHGGEVGFESPRGGGSIFRVLLPADARPRAEVVAMSDTLERGALRLVPADFESQTPAPTAAMLAPASTPEGTVLVAEDDPRLLEAIGKLLSARYRVLLAGDGISALRLARAHLPDLLVSDVGMPGMDGLELTRRFRELPGNRLAPVVLLTAFSSLSDRLSGFEAGAIDYVAKPFDPAELLARVRSQLEIRALALKLHQSEKLAALGTLSAGLAHEMRNPANAIVNAIGPLSELLPPELIGDDHPVGQLIGVLRECAAQIALLSRQLLGFKRQGELERAENRLTDVIGRARALVQPLFKNVTLKESLEYRGSLSCAAPLLTQVLANLLDNAAHAAGPGGWVQLGSRSDGNRLVLEVSDSGPGVPPELRERIFEPFFTTKPPGAGTGLGLTTARQIVERHGGTLDVRDGASGSVFRIELPLGDSGKALMAASDRKTGGVG